VKTATANMEANQNKGTTLISEMTAAAGNYGIRRTVSKSRETSYMQQGRQQQQELANESYPITLATVGWTAADTRIGTSQT
jgi:hypothetical protein